MKSIIFLYSFHSSSALHSNILLLHYRAHGKCFRVSHVIIVSCNIERRRIWFWETLHGSTVKRIESEWEISPLNLNETIYSKWYSKFLHFFPSFDSFRCSLGGRDLIPELKQIAAANATFYEINIGSSVNIDCDYVAFVLSSFFRCSRE